MEAYFHSEINTLGYPKAALFGFCLALVAYNMLAVIMAASVMDASGGIDFLVRIAERIIRANPKYVTIVAPLTTWSFTFVAGTGHIVYPLLPVIYETAHQNGIRPERPMAVATIASQQAITASPVAAATPLSRVQSALGRICAVAQAGHLIGLKILSRDDERRPQDHVDLAALRARADEAT